jgi:hypothetical protein
MFILEESNPGLAYSMQLLGGCRMKGMMFADSFPVGEEIFYNQYRVKTRSGIDSVSYQKFTWSLLCRSEVADG